MASLMDKAPALPNKNKTQTAVRADDQIRAECHLRTQYPSALIKFVYGRGGTFNYRVNEYAPDLSRILNSEFITVTVDGDNIEHVIKTVR